MRTHEPVIVAAVKPVALEDKLLLAMMREWISAAYAVIIHLLYDDCTGFSQCEVQYAGSVWAYK